MKINKNQHINSIFHLFSSFWTAWNFLFPFFEPFYWRKKVSRKQDDPRNLMNQILLSYHICITHTAYIYVPLNIWQTLIFYYYLSSVFSLYFSRFLPPCANRIKQGQEDNENSRFYWFPPVKAIKLLYTAHSFFINTKWSIWEIYRSTDIWKIRH